MPSQDIPPVTRVTASSCGRSLRRGHRRDAVSRSGRRAAMAGEERASGLAIYIPILQLA